MVNGFDDLCDIERIDPTLFSPSHISMIKTFLQSVEERPKRLKPNHLDNSKKFESCLDRLPGMEIDFPNLDLPAPIPVVIKIVQKTYNMLDPIKFDTLSPPRNFRMSYYLRDDRESFEIREHMELLSVITAMLWDILDLHYIFACFSESLWISRDADKTKPRFGSMKADVSYSSIPFFLAGIKRPDTWEIPELLLYAQQEIYDRMVDLRQCHGIQKPYSMITSYTKFQICWLEEDEVTQEEPILHVSPIYSLNTMDHQDVRLIILNALFRGFLALSNRKTFQEYPDGYYQTFTKSSICHEYVVIPKLQCKIPHVPLLPSDLRLHLLRKFPNGIEGSVYHVFDSTGSQGVLKVFSLEYLKNVKESAKDLSEREKELWMQINSIQIQTVTLDNQLSVLMPLLMPITREEKISFVDKDSAFHQHVIRLYTNLVDLGYEQVDASWRHIGRYQGDGDSQLKLLDFGHVEKIEAKERSKALKRMLTYIGVESSYLTDTNVSDLFSPIVTSASSATNESKAQDDQLDD